MRPYEIMVIFDVASEESDIQQMVDRVVEHVKSSGGTPGAVSHWGRRSFAYEMNHHTEGYYVLIEAVAEPGALSGVDRLLALDDSVLRHKVIRQPEKLAGRRQGSATSAPPAASAPRSEAS